MISVDRQHSVKLVEIVASAERQSLPTHVSQYYHDQHIYANPIHDHHYELTQKYMRLTGAKTIYRNDLKVDCLPSKLLVLCRSHELDRSFEIFQQELGDDATPSYGSLGWFLEVLHPEVNKGHGLRRMCDTLGIPLEECIAFGDRDNDLEFSQLAGHGIVMKNGREVVKKHADEVIDYTNNELSVNVMLISCTRRSHRLLQDGVMKTLRRMEEEGLLHLN